MQAAVAQQRAAVAPQRALAAAAPLSAAAAPPRAVTRSTYTIKQFDDDTIKTLRSYVITMNTMKF